MKTVALWQISTEAPNCRADDVTGKGAEETGGRWNHPAPPKFYASSSIALACLETVVHLRANGLPLNRYLVKISVQEELLETCEVFDPDKTIGWVAEPAGKTSLDYGTQWCASKRSVLLRVPSVIVPEEPNFLINTRHSDVRKIRAEKIRRFHYDLRLR
ncbi:MAG: RES domain-containing protein [Proteobacteria bacterium]|nr:MAG: RES domain-containing protein [Pseudomonadota bacterium]